MDITIMFNQEVLYQLIYDENWKQILTELYKHRKEIGNDPMLSYAGKIFEQAFFSKIKALPKSNEITEYLETLYILHHSNFYSLANDNYRSLILELVQRKPKHEAVNYAKAFPEEPLCQAVIAETAFEQYQHSAHFENNNTIPVNWIEIYNRLFALINDQDDTATYFSGPRFINVVRETEPYFPDYNQYIAQRQKQGKSTSRKIFFYDILIGLSAASQQSVMIRFLDLLRPFRGPQVEQIEVLLGLRKADFATHSMPSNPDFPEVAPVTAASSTSPIVFISYSWDSEEHKQWVLNLANRLRSNGVDVILDRYYLNAGKSVTHFVENSIRRGQSVIIIFTSNYKLRADGRSGGVGYEYSIVNNSLYQNQTGNDKIIPVLRLGSMADSIPEFMQQYIHLDLRNDTTFETSYTDLLREIFNEPAIKMPEIGERPTF